MRTYVGGIAGRESPTDKADSVASLCVRYRFRTLQIPWQPQPGLQATLFRLALICSRMSSQSSSRDEDAGKGAVEQDRPDEETNVSRTGEIGHRNQDALLKSSDSDFPEPGQNEEHTGEPQGPNELQRDTKAGCQGETPGSQQKNNQNKEKNDPLAG